MATTPYLSVSAFTALTLAPASYVTEVEAAEAGWLLGQLVHWTAWINSRLHKRYAVPFASPYPETAVNWLNDIVTRQLYIKLGYDPTDKQSGTIESNFLTAKAEVLEAANSVSGLFELPLRADLTGSGISRGGPLGYTEASPYVWTTRQRDTAIDEDQQ